MFAQAAGFDSDFRAQDLAFLPIDSWIESPQPRISEDCAVFAQGGDVEGLEVTFEPLADPKGAELGESSCDVFRSIHVKNSPWNWQFPCSNPKASDHGVVHEVFGCTAVNKRTLVGPSPFAQECKVSGDSFNC